MEFLDSLPKSIRSTVAIIIAALSVAVVGVGFQTWVDSRADAAVPRSPILVELRADMKDVKASQARLEAGQQRHACALRVVAARGGVDQLLACDDVSK